MADRPLQTSLPSTHAAASQRSTATTTAHQTSPKQQHRHQLQRAPQARTHAQSRQTQHPRSHNLNENHSSANPATMSNPNVDPRHMAIAVHHAHRIQSQKDTQALILDRILDLLAYPRSSPTADPANPDPADAHAFKHALTPFRPTDYDNLIQERNIEGLCGYGLCPREHRREDSGGGFRLRFGKKGSGPGGRGREMNIVTKESLEKWCSDECAERAMYIRVQLAEEPVWERQGKKKVVVLLEEARAQQERRMGRLRSLDGGSTVGQVMGQLENMHMHGHGHEGRDITEQIQGLSIGDRELAVERGDSSSSAFGQGGRVDVNIRENAVSRDHVTPPQLRREHAQGGSIEGYWPNQME